MFPMELPAPKRRRLQAPNPVMMAHLVVPGRAAVVLVIMWGALVVLQGLVQGLELLQQVAATARVMVRGSGGNACSPHCGGHVASSCGVSAGTPLSPTDRRKCCSCSEDCRRRATWLVCMAWMILSEMLLFTWYHMSGASWGLCTAHHCFYGVGGFL